MNVLIRKNPAGISGYYGLNPFGFEFSLDNGQTWLAASRLFGDCPSQYIGHHEPARLAELISAIRAELERLGAQFTEAEWGPLRLDRIRAIAGAGRGARGSDLWPSEYRGRFGWFRTESDGWCPPDEEHGSLGWCWGYATSPDLRPANQRFAEIDPTIGVAAGHPDEPECPGRGERGRALASVLGTLRAEGYHVAPCGD